jgi:3-methyladenine DNA glycosylase Tag
MQALSEALMIRFHAGAFFISDAYLPQKDFLAKKLKKKSFFFCDEKSCRNFMSLVAISTEDQKRGLLSRSPPIF